MASAELVLRMIGAAMLMLLAVVWWRDSRGHLTGPLGALFCFGIASYLLCPLAVRVWHFGIVEAPILFGCFGSAVFFWLLSQALFDDGFRLRPWHGGVLLLMEALGGGRWLVQCGILGPYPGFDVVGVLLSAHQILSLILIVAALVLAWRGWPGDLVEARRRFRGLFVGVSGAYAAIVVATEIYLRTEPAGAGLDLLNVTLIDLIVFAFAVGMTRLQPALLPAVAAPRSPGRPPDPPDLPADAGEPMLLALRSLMEEGEAYRQEGLTIGRLAEQLSIQEYRLRRLINGMLGYRNFSEFLNSYRLAEARRCLADPACAHLPILTIAMDCGYASLGPFNRAFKQATEMTPSEFRRRHLGTAQPQS